MDNDRTQVNTKGPVPYNVVHTTDYEITSIFSISETKLDDLDEILQLLPCRNESDPSTSEINYLALNFHVR